MGFMDKAKQWADDADRKSAVVRAATTRSQTVEYDVVEIREKFFDQQGAAPSQKLNRLLNERAALGWRLRQLVSAEVAGAVAKRDGWMIVFERDVIPDVGDGPS